MYLGLARLKMCENMTSNQVFQSVPALTHVSLNMGYSLT